ADTSKFALSSETAAYADSSAIAANTYKLEGNSIGDLDSIWLNEGQASSISDSMIQAGAVTSDKIADGTIITADAAPDFKAPYADTADYALTANIVSVDSANVAANAHKLEENSLTDLDSRWVNEGQASSISDSMIQAGAVTSDKIADSTISSADAASDFKAPYADTADYAIAANVVSVDSAIYADTANYAINAGASTTSNFADSSDAAAYAHEAGHATYADTAQYTIGGGSAAYADSAGVSVNAHRLQGKDTTALDSRYVNEGQNNSVTGAMIQDGSIQGVDIAKPCSLSASSASPILVVQNTGSGAAGYFHGNVKVASNITSDDYYKGVENEAESTLVTKKYVDDQVAGISDNDWIIDGNVLYPGGQYGLSMRGNNILFGNNDSSHVNLGIACTTGALSEDYEYCTVGGGHHNTASNIIATVGGGSLNTAKGYAASIIGGYHNSASSIASVVGGGWENNASGYAASVGGGYHNTANSITATVGGGWHNTASGNHSTVGGGNQNTANNHYSTVCGGEYNTNSGEYSVIPGGYKNQLTGDHSLLFGIADTFDFDSTFIVGTPRIYFNSDSIYFNGEWYNTWGATAAYSDSARVSANAHKLQGKDTTALDSRWVNTNVPDTISVTNSSGPALYIVSQSNSTIPIDGFKVEVTNNSTGSVCGVRGSGYVSSNNPAYGVWGQGDNTSTGEVYGGYFSTTNNGTGVHYGVYAESDSFGIYAKSTSPTGNYAGYFDGNVKVASNITADDFYKGIVNVDSTLMTKKYIDKQAKDATYNGYHAPALTISMSPDSSGNWVCDGTSDDVEIQAALDSINILGGGVVYIKHGTYNLGSNLTVYSNIALIGSGAGTILNHPSGQSVISAYSKTQVVIENLRLIGGTNYAIYFYNTTDSEIKHCWVENSGTSGIAISGSSGNYSHNNVITNNICNCSGNHCIYIEGYENVIQGNNCRNSNSSGACIYLTGAESNVIVGNVMEGTGNNYGIFIVDNSMDNTITGNTLIKGQLYLYNSTWNTVSSNTVFQHRIALAACSLNTVVGNVVREYTGTPSGIYLSFSDFNTISSNTCCNHTHDGIYINNSSNNMITNNICTYNGSDGIEVTQNSNYNVVNDNRCVNNTNDGINVAMGNCDENVIQNNMLKGNTTSSYTDSGNNTRDDEGGGGRCTQGTANFE
ncbi:right-handed parallel beta-helix repeat-containing protein, partial [candidate division WOR-3 bacterium]|nr:right-handed parallel beta-helix repeat-containing protein [candidate division WOR-3 bacterium]